MSFGVGAEMETYLLHNCDAPPTNVTNLPKVKVVKVPVENSVVLDTEALGFFERLGLSSKLAAVVPSTKITSPCQLDIASSRASNEFIWGPSDNTKYSQYLKFSSYLATEVTPLSRARLGLFIVGAFYNMESEANAIYSGIESSYICNKKAFSNGTSKRQFRNAAWVQRTMNNSINVDQEFARVLFGDVEIFLATPSSKQEFSRIDMLFDTSVAENSWTDLPSANFIQNKAVYRLDKSIGGSANASDFQGSGAAYPDYLLGDIMHTIDPSFSPSYSKRFVRNAATEASSPRMSISSTVCVSSTYATCASSTPTLLMEFQKIRL